MSIRLSTEVKRQWATLVLGWVTTSVHYCCLMALQLALVDQNPFRPCLFNDLISTATNLMQLLMLYSLLFRTPLLSDKSITLSTWLDKRGSSV